MRPGRADECFAKLSRRVLSKIKFHLVNIERTKLITIERRHYRRNNYRVADERVNILNVMITGYTYRVRYRCSDTSRRKWNNLISLPVIPREHCGMK